MHALEVIIDRNRRAAGRAAAHADNDDNDRKASEIVSIELAESGHISQAFADGYVAGQKEG